MVVRKKKGLISRPAPLWKRLLAFMIDLLVLEFFVFSHFESLMQRFVPQGNVMQLQAGVIGPVSFILGIIGFFVVVYFTVLEYSFGQTLGAMAVNIKLISTQTLSLWRVALSNLIFFPFFPFFIFWILDPLVLFFSETHQRFMHLLLGFQVVEEYTLEDYSWGG